MRHLWGGIVGAATAGLIGLTLIPATAAQAASPSTKTYEWGRAVALHGPGPVPTLVPLTGETSVDAGNQSDTAIMPGGTVEAWGGMPLNRASLNPVAVPDLTKVVQVADGDADFVALEAPSGITAGACPTDTTVWTWGANIDGDLGTGVMGKETSEPPQELTSLNGLGVVQVVAASRHMMALTCTGQVYVWGWNYEDDLGIPSPDSVLTPVLDPTATSLTNGTAANVQLSDGRDQSSILVDGQEYDWGANNHGQCGCGTSQKFSYRPQPVSQPVSFVAIDDGGDDGDDGQNLAADAQGNVYCWGYNAYGECGLGTTTDVSAPTRVPGLPPVAQVRAGGLFSLFLTDTGDVWAAGDDAHNQLGDGSTVNRQKAIEVLSGITQISAGAAHSLAIG